MAMTYKTIRNSNNNMILFVIIVSIKKMPQGFKFNWLRINQREFRCMSLDL